MRVQIMALGVIAAAALAACAPQHAQTSADEDQCGAARYQYLIGRPRSEIPAAPADARWRVTCTACAVTMDFMPTRLNIFFDDKTQIVEKVRCG